MSNRAPGRPTAPPTDAPRFGASRDPTTEERVAPPTGGLRANAPAAAARLTVAVGEPPEHLFRRLLSAYLAGAEAFVIDERPRLTRRTRDVVAAFCYRTRGPELVRSTPDSLELADRDPGPTGDLDDRLVQLGERVLTFHREAVASWSHLPLGDDGFWPRRDDEVDREAWYIERGISRDDGPGRPGTRTVTAAWTIARSLERIADHAVTLGEVGPRLAELGPAGGPVRELRQFHRQATAHLEEVLRGRGRRANDLLDVGEALLAGGRALSERLLPAVGDGSMPPAAAAAVARAFEAIGRTVAYSQDIAQAFFDRAEPPLRSETAAPPSPAEASAPA